MSQGSFTDAQVHEWLQVIANNAYVALHYDSPLLGGIGSNEISGGGYSRVKVSFSAPANRTIWSLSDALFTGLVQTQLTHFSIWNAQTGGRMNLQGRLPAVTTILNGRGFQIMTGELAVSLA